MADTFWVFNTEVKYVVSFEKAIAVHFDISRLKVSGIPGGIPLLAEPKKLEMRDVLL